MGRTRVVNRLPQFVEAVQQRAARAATAAVVRVGSELTVLVPIDTSDLLNSQYREVGVDGTRVYGRVGFTAEYAKAVHEAEGKLKGQKRPKRDGKDRGRFWGPHDGQPRFLEVAGERAADDVRGIITGTLKV